MTVRRAAVGARRHGRRAVAFGGVRLATAGHAPRGVRRPVAVAACWSTACPYCRAPLLAGPTGELPAHLRPGTSIRCGGGTPVPDIARWLGVGELVGAGIRSW